MIEVVHGKERNPKVISVKEYYNYYRTVASRDMVYLPIFRKIFSEFCEFMGNELLKGEKIFLPDRMGSLQIIGKKLVIKKARGLRMYGLPPKFGTTRKLWKASIENRRNKLVVPFMNEHKDNVVYRVNWYKKGISGMYKNGYKFRTATTLKKKMFENIMGGKEYIIPKKFYRKIKPIKDEQEQNEN